jgi:hypothetical protein
MYIATFTILAALSLYDLFSSRRRVVLWLLATAGLCLALHDGLRWEVGTDWDNYHNLYKGSFRGEETVIESGYNLLSSAVSLVSEDYTTFLLVHACIIYTLFVSTIQKIAVAPLLSMLIFYCLMLRYLGMNRQYLAVAICFFSLRYIIARKPLGFLICLALALSFHRTAVLFLPAYFLVGKIDLRVLLACIVGTALLGFTGLGDKLEPRIFLAAGDVIVERLYFYKDLDMFDLSATGIVAEKSSHRKT